MHNNNSEFGRIFNFKANVERVSLLMWTMTFYYLRNESTFVHTIPKTFLFHFTWEWQTHLFLFLFVHIAPLDTNCPIAGSPFSGELPISLPPTPCYYIKVVLTPTWLLMPSLWHSQHVWSRTWGVQGNRPEKGLPWSTTWERRFTKPVKTERCCVRSN